MNKLDYFFKTLFLVLITLFISACGSKQLTVKSLSPSLMHQEKISTIILEDFTNDNINQANHLEEKLVNTQVENKHLFKLQNSYENIDAIITGEVLDSSLYFDLYHNYERDYSRCYRYEYVNNKRTSICIEYAERRIPCERREYRVKTKIQVLNNYEEIIFSKIYLKLKRTNECYENRYFYNSSFYRHFNVDRQEEHYNQELAKSIADDFINDIAPHYIYQKVTIIEELTNNIYTQEIKEEFKSIVELLYNKNIDISNTKLHNLNIKLQRESYEVLYNLALSYEAKNQLKKAKDLYEESKYVFDNFSISDSDNIEHLKLINTAINRMQLHLENKIKAKSQLS